jgi:serine/threonine protein kinase
MRGIYHHYSNYNPIVVIMEYQTSHNLIKKDDEAVFSSSEEARIKKILLTYLNGETEGVMLFIKYIFPFIRKYRNGPILGRKIISDIKLINDGAHGTTFRIQDILIKIFKNKKRFSGIKTQEIENIYRIFYNDDHTPSKVPKQINNFIGFITNDLQVCNKVGIACNKKLSEEHLFTNLSPRYISSKDMISYHHKHDFCIDDCTKITALVLEFEEYEVIDYFKGSVVGKDNLNNFLNNFINDMYVGLKYLHHTKHMIHNDIKYENIVTSYDKSLNRYIFKLIDFGLANTVENYTDIVGVEEIYGTPYFFNRTIFKFYRSFLYDWYCLAVTIFDLFGLSRRSADILLNPGEDTLHIRDIQGNWVTIGWLKLDQIDSYMDHIHKTYMSGVNECLIDFMKSIMKFRFYIGSDGEYLIDIGELCKEFYFDNGEKIC